MKRFREKRTENILKLAQEIYDDIANENIVIDVTPRATREISSTIRYSDERSSRYGLCNILKTLFGLASIEMEEYRDMAMHIKGLIKNRSFEEYPFVGDINYLYPPTRDYIPQRLKLLKQMLEKYLISDSDPLLKLI